MNKISALNIGPVLLQYFESLLQEFEEQNERDISGAVKDYLKQNTKLQKMQAKLGKGLKEKKFLDDVSVFPPCLFVSHTTKNIFLLFLFSPFGATCRLMRIF